MVAQAHTVAAAAAAAAPDPAGAANAYAAAMRAFGFGLCATARAQAATAPPAPSVAPPTGTSLTHAMVDSMATFWVVPSVDMLSRVTNPNPGFSIETANGMVPVTAVGIAMAYFLIGSKWVCHAVPNVLVLEGCPAILYSTRAMKKLFSFKHDIDAGTIEVPGTNGIAIHDDGSAYTIPVAFGPPGAPVPSGCVHPSVTTPVANLADVSAAFPAGVAGTPQATLFHRLGFPYDDQWRHVPSATSGHGLPPDSRVTSSLPVRDAVVRGRSRALPFYRKQPDDTTQPPPAAVFYMDFAGPMIPSIFHRFVCYSGVVDAGSGYGRAFPSHGMTAAVASSALATFTADVAAHMGYHGQFKPLVVRSDQGSAFISHHFREFLLDRQIKQSLSATYTPQQNSHIERFWGIVFGTARVLLAAANLPPSFHPFAVQTAAWLSNRLPRPSRGDQSPLQVLSHSLPDLSALYCFGCLCAATLPTARRDGDRHFADRGEYAIYLGPSEESPAHVIYLLSSRRIDTRPKIRVWEDEFPGIRGERYAWFADSTGADGVVPPAGGAPAATDGGFMRGAATDGEFMRGLREDNDRRERERQQAERQAPSPAAPPAARPPPAAAPPAADAEGAAVQPGGAAPPLSAPRSAGSPGGAQPPPMRHPQADDSRSRHFERRHPQRTRSRPDRYGSAARLLTSDIPTVAYAAAFSIFYALCAASRDVASDQPRVQIAYLSCVQDVSSSFTPTGTTMAEGYLVDAACRASHAFAVTITAELGSIDIPKSYRHAIRSRHAEYWREAMAKELGGLVALHTWDLVLASNMPPGSNLMNCHYVYTVKRKSDGSIEKWKARLVADGNTQKYGVDFDRVFSTVVKTSTIRLVLIIAAARDYNLSSIDIRQAYLQALLQEDLFMRPPPGIWPFDSQRRPLVCKLRRSLYGLKQAGREWATLFTSFLVQWGMVRSSIDTCMYTFTDQDTGHILWVLVYVDDALLADSCRQLRDRFVTDLSARFPTEDKGELEWILNVAITRDRVARTLDMSQSLYIADLLGKYGSLLPESCTRRFDCPLDEGLELSADDQPAIGSPEHASFATAREQYMSIIGGLLWLANMTMPQLAFAAGQLARFLTNPGRPHHAAAIRVLLYLRHAGDRPLHFAPSVERGLETFVDSNWAVRFSCSGCMILYHGCLFHWFSKMQRSVSLSSAEAEYFGAMMAARDVIFARELLVDLDIVLDGASIIFSDSKSAVDMAFDAIAFKKTKHILRAAEFLRDLVAREVVTLRHVAGTVMIADLLTKAVARAVYVELLRLLDAYAQSGVACPS